MTDKKALAHRSPKTREQVREILRRAMEFTAISYSDERVPVVLLEAPIDVVSYPKNTAECPRDLPQVGERRWVSVGKGLWGEK